MRQIYATTILLLLGLSTLQAQTVFKTRDEVLQTIYIKKGYPTQIEGWKINDGDTLQLGKGSMPNKGFSFIYQSPAAYGGGTSIDGTIRRNLASAWTNRMVRIKELFPYGTNKTGFLVFAKIGVNDVGNYWIELDNAIDAGEVLPPKEYRKETSATQQKTVSVADELLKFKQLLDAGAINQSEYDIQKKRLLNQ